MSLRCIYPADKPPAGTHCSEKQSTLASNYSHPSHYRVRTPIMEQSIKIQLLNKFVAKGEGKGIMPKKMKPDDAGYDLYSTETHMLEPGERKLFLMKFRCAIPKKHVGVIFPRSSLWEQKLDVLNGVVDPNFRGEVRVGLENSSNRLQTVRAGDRIGQAIFFETKSNVEQVDYIDPWDTVRGTRGFGSSGRNDSCNKCPNYLQTGAAELRLLMLRTKSCPRCLKPLDKSSSSGKLKCECCIASLTC